MELLFENTVEISEMEYIKDILPLSINSKRKRSLISKIIFLLLIIILFLWKYTVSLSIAIIVVSSIYILVLKIIKYQYKSKYIIRILEKNDYRARFNLQQSVVFGYNEKYLYVKTEGFEAKVDWEYLIAWDYSDKWLQINCSGIFPFYFNIDNLKKENKFENIVEIAKIYINKPFFQNKN